MQPASTSGLNAPWHKKTCLHHYRQDTEDLKQVFISYEIYEISLQQVS